MKSTEEVDLMDFHLCELVEHTLLHNRPTACNTKSLLIVTSGSSFQSALI